MSDAIEVLLKALQTEIKKLRREIIGGIDDVTTK